MFSHLLRFLSHRQSVAVGAVFLVMGTLFGNWATLIPIIKSKFGLDDAQLGLIILCMPVGAALANPASSWFIHRYGMQKMTLTAMVAMSLCYLLPVLSPVAWGVGLGLFVTGIMIAFTNVSMNTCASIIEHRFKHHIMSTCHGLFSLGLMLGSLMASTLIGLKTPPVLQSLIISGLMLLIWLMVRSQILQIEEDLTPDEEPVKPRFTFPKGPLLLMIGIALCTNLTEGSMADWTAVYLRDVVAAPEYLIGWGLASYSFFMAMGRFSGDYFIPRYGAQSILKYGGLMSAMAIAVAVFFPKTWICIAAFGFVGLGVSCGAPIMYGAATRLPNLAKGVGLATLNTFSVTTFLGGPVIIGFISKAIHLQAALFLVCLAGLVWVYLSTRLKL